MPLKQKRIGFIGAGAMAEALAGGLIAGGVAARDLRVADVSEARRRQLEASLGVRACETNAAVVADSDVVVLAVKPAVVASALGDLDTVGLELGRPLWISIAAGIPLARLAAPLPVGARVVRAMPNTPALVRAGATAICGNADVTRDDLALARALFECVGTCWLAPDEALLDAVTGLSGSGPAYVFAFLEALAGAGERVGLPAGVASELAAQTVYGAAKLALESADSPTVLREKVSSPNGTTVAGLAQLAEHGFAQAIEAAVEAATRRAVELGRD